ncbi:MAG: hypothetical protein R3D80_20015 [Paracoccaceae bacterium]
MADMMKKMGKMGKGKMLKQAMQGMFAARERAAACPAGCLT